MEKIKNLWNNNQNTFGTFGQKVLNKTKTITAKLNRNRTISKGGTSIIMMGLVVNLIGKLDPEFIDRFHVLYGWVDGWLQVGEIVLKGLFGGLYALFTGSFGVF